MPVDRSETLPAALPPTDHVARVLLKEGARDEALIFLRAAVARDPGERACAALLRAVEARPDASVYGPDLTLDLDLVEAYTRSGMLVEALAVLRGARLDRTPRGQWRARSLEELLSPCPADADDELREADAQLRSGGAVVALTALQERLARDPRLPDWARRKHDLLSELLLEGAEPAPRDSSVERIHRTPLAKALSERFASRDVDGALEAAKRLSREHPDDLEAAAVVEALGRLHEGMGRASAEMGGPMLSTQPMTGHTTALFQLRMGNLAEAERFFRKLVLEEPLDQLARQRLEDVQTVRQAIEGPGRLSSPSIPAQPAASPAPADPDVDPLMQTALDGRKYESEEVRQAREAFLRTAPFEAEPTRRVRADEVVPEPAPSPAPIAPEATVRARPRGPAEDEAVHEQTRVAPAPDPEPPDSEPPTEPRLPSSPGLLHKRGRRVTADPGWAAPPPPRPADWEEEDSTEVGSPQQQAELLLKQGYADQALRTYEVLVEAMPQREDLRRRRDEIRQLVSQKVEPPTRVGVQVPEAYWDDAEPTIDTSASPEGTDDDGGVEVRVHRIIRID